MSSKKTINIILVEDQKLFAFGLKEILNKFEGVRVINVIDDGDLLSSELENQQVDVLFLDLNLPNKNGLAVLSEIRVQHPDIFIIILTMYQEKILIEKAKKLGANAYLTKDVSVEELKETVFLDINSPFYISKNIRNLVQNTDNQRNKTTLITDREKEVLKYLVKNQNPKKIANNLNISTKAIETHIKNIKRKLNTTTEAELIDYVLNNKII
jgi:two-component system nitrate/nitrite response regulator NarL